MSKKKTGSAAKQPAPSQKKTAEVSRGRSKTLWILAGIAAVLVIGGYVASRSSGGGAGTGAVPADEAKYLGRYLPAGYEEPKVGDGGKVSADTPMSPVTATQDDTGLTLAVADITAVRNAAFEYKKDSGEAVPMIAYVKPSGKLFVGVVYCVPCKGTGQTLTTDGMLTCDSCGTKRDPESGVGVSGACKLYPLDELPVKVSDGKIVVEKAALEAWTVQPTDRQVGG